MAVLFPAWRQVAVLTVRPVVVIRAKAPRRSSMFSICRIRVALAVLPFRRRVPRCRLRARWLEDRLACPVLRLGLVCLGA